VKRKVYNKRIYNSKITRKRRNKVYYRSIVRRQVKKALKSQTSEILVKFLKSSAKDAAPSR